MPTMTKREAIKECKLLWKEIRKSGLTKQEFFANPEGKEWLEKDYNCNCPLCEYVRDTGCGKCPLMLQYGVDCSGLEYYRGSPRWFKAVRGLKEGVTK